MRHIAVVKGVDFLAVNACVVCKLDEFSCLCDIFDEHHLLKRRLLEGGGLQTRSKVPIQSGRQGSYFYKK